MMESIKAFLLNSILESIEKQQQIVLPWWWVFLPSSWKKEFSELLIVAIYLCKKTSVRHRNDDAASIDQHKHSYEPTEHGLQSSWKG